MNLVFIVSGGGGILRKTAIAIHRGVCTGWRIAKVVADRECGALNFAREKAIACCCVPFAEMTRAEFDARLCAEVSSASADLVVLAYNRILSGVVVDALYERLINVHFSLLPAFHGFRAVERARESGVLYSGSTIHRVNATADAGRIVAQAVIAMDPSQSLAEQRHGIFMSACWNLLNVLDHFGHGRIRFEGRERVVYRNVSFHAGPFLPNLSECVAAHRNGWEDMNEGS